MGTLWQFFGFPDPETPAPEAAKKPRKKKSKSLKDSPGQQLTLVNPDDEAVSNDLVDAQIIEVLVTANLEIIKMLDWFGGVLCCMFNGCSWGTAWGTCICAWPFAYPVWPAGGCLCWCMTLCGGAVLNCCAVLLLGSVVMAPCILQPLPHLLLFELLLLQLNLHPPYLHFLLY